VDKTCEKAKGSIQETGGAFLYAFLLCLCGDDADAAAGCAARHAAHAAAGRHLVIRAESGIGYYLQPA